MDGMAHLPISGWGGFHQTGPVPSNINSLLSTRSYLLPESYNSNDHSTSSLDTALRVASSNRTENQSLSEPITSRPRKSQRRGLKAAPAKDCRAQVGDKENYKERRRMQARMAQRAYRSRQQATADGLKNRISLLETSIERLSSSMLSFSEQLVQSGILGPQNALAGNLRDTLKTFITLAAKITDTGVSDDDSHIPLEPPASQQLSFKRPPLNIPRPLDGTGSLPPGQAILSNANRPGISIIGVTAFIQKLIVVALYQGYLALRDPSIGLDRLQRPFGLVFSMMSRERLTTHFTEELNSQLSHKPVEGWDGVPFFRLGGAGNHYPSTESSTFHYESGIVEEPLALVTGDLKQQLAGEWFDLRDLEGYLRDQNVLLVSSAGESMKSSESQTCIDVSRFIPALVSRGVCLGRTPGFRRDDVEEALRFSKVFTSK